MIMMNFPRFDSKKTLGGISPVEILLYFWVFSILIEEIRQVSVALYVCLPLVVYVCRSTCRSVGWSVCLSV